MSRFNTGNVIPSLAEEDFYDNCLSLDQAMNSTDPTWRDRFGVEKPTIDAALKSAGFMPAGFDFVTGGTLQPGDRNKAVYNPMPNGDNNWYRWNGVFPKEIAANSQPNPKDENNWVPVIIKTGVVEREALRRTYLEVGYNLVEGSFEQGGVLVNVNDVLLQERTGKVFSGPAGTVAAGTVPSGPNYTNRGDGTLRSDLANPDKGAAMVARGVVAVDSIADLLALPEGQRKEGLRYLVKGYHAGTDVGGGEFFWDNTSTEDDNGGTVFAVAGVAIGRWRRVVLDYISPEIFGAIGDGVNDDATELQKAADFASSSNMSLKLGKPSYFVSSALNVSCNLDGNNAEIVVPSGIDFRVLTLDSTSGVTVSRLRFRIDGGGAVGKNCSAVAVIGPTNNITIEDVDTEGFNSGIYFDGSFGSMPEDAAYSVTLAHAATGGTWAIGIMPLVLGEPQWTANISFNASAAQVNSAIDAAIGVGNSSVSGPSGGPYKILFTGDYAGVYIPNLLVKFNLTGSNARGVVPTCINKGGGPWISAASLKGVRTSGSSSTWGMHFDYVDGLVIDNCSSTHNWLDGVKLRKHVIDTTIISGHFDDNGQGWFNALEQVAGDGMDTYAGGYNLRVVGATFNRNAGSGIQMKNDGSSGLTGRLPGKHGINRKVELHGIEASFNRVGNGLTLTHNSGPTSYALSDISVFGGFFEGNRYSGVFANGHRITLSGVTAARNEENGIVVGPDARDVEVTSCKSIANGTGPATGIGLHIDGQRVQVSGGEYIGVDSEGTLLDSDISSLTRYHIRNINVSHLARDVHIRWVSELYNNPSGGRGITVNESAMNVVVWQSPTQTGLFPSSSAVHGSPGSIMLKTDAVDPADYLWVKMAGANHQPGSWKRLAGLGVSIKSGNYTALPSDDVISVSTVGAERTITLPPATGNKGVAIQVIRNSASSNNLIVTAVGGENINGVPSKTLGDQWASIKVVSDGARWLILSQNGSVS